MQPLKFSSASSSQFWKETMSESESGSGWVSYTLFVITLLFIFQLITTKRFISLFRFFFKSDDVVPHNHNPNPNPTVSQQPNTQKARISGIISDLDLKTLIDNLDEEFHENEKWDNVIDKRTNLFSYNAKCCKPKDGPLKYMSVTIFEDCSAEMLRDFYMDNDYRKQWDRTLIDHEQLQVDEISGTEIGCTIKKFPLLTPREYVLAWRLWEGNDGSYYCYSKGCEHSLVPRQKKYVRVRFFRSGWRIRKVPGRKACEIKMVHQEDAGLNVEMAKLAFARGIWSYVCKMDNALRKYPAIRSLQSTSAVNAITLIQKVPPGLDINNNAIVTAPSETLTEMFVSSQIVAGESIKKKLSRRPSNKFIAKGLLVAGGVICLYRGHNLGVKVAVAYVLSKLTKRGVTSTQNAQPSVL